MATNKKQVGIRIKPQNYDKLKVIAEKNSRTVTNQVEYLVARCIEDYEEKYGQIAPVINTDINNQQVGTNISFVNGK